MYQQVIVENGASISSKNNQLVIHTNDVHRLAIEDVSTLVLDNPCITVTIPVLNQLLNNGSAVIICSEKHTPNGLFVPYAGYARRLKTLKKQMTQTKPRLKQLWKQIVQKKIKNQGRSLELCGKENKVKKFGDKVTSGDGGHMEGIAAAIYFKELYGEDFVRESFGLINGILNYGYSILRSAIARYLAIYGFEPALGIFHHSELNAFNLADDLIEPFRPLVDIYAFSYMDSEEEFLTKEMRRDLVELLNCDILLDKETYSVDYAIERVVQSLSRCYDGKANELLLPDLLPLHVHSYE